MSLPKPLTHEDISAYNSLEFIMLLGFAGTGKSYAILSLAETWKQIKPEGKIYVIDVETGLAKTFKAAFPHLTNILIWHGDQVDDSDKFIDVFTELSKIVTPDDWLCMESDTRIWDMCQDTGWQKVTGQVKDEYLSKRLASGSGAVTPHPDQLWQVVLDAYRRRFRNVLVNQVRLKTNVLVTTGLAKSSPRVSQDQRLSMKLLGIDVQPDGHAENARNPDTVIMLSRESDGYYADVLKDRASDKPGKRIRFKVDKFLTDFMANCRGHKDSNDGIKNIADLLARANLERGLKRKDILTILKIDELSKIVDLNKAYLTLKEWKKSAE